MPSKATRDAMFINFLANFAKGFQDSRARDADVKRDLAKQMLDRQEKEKDRDLAERRFALEAEEATAGSTVIGPDGVLYQTSGVSPEFSARVRLPGMMGPLPQEAYQTESVIPGAKHVGRGKLSVMRPLQERAQPEPITNVTVDEFNANPDQYRDKKIKVVPSPKKAGMNPAQQLALFSAKELYKQYLQNGTLNESQATQLRDLSAQLDVNLVPEEEHGFLYGIQKLISGSEFQPKVSRPTKNSSQVAEIKRRDPRNGKTAVFDADTKKFLRYE